MSYTPTEWKTGDIVSSQRLNKLEEGVRDAYEVMVINNVYGDPAQSANNLLRVTTDRYLDKTWQQIFDAMSAGRICIVKDADETSVNMIAVSGANSKGYMIFFGQYECSASSADGYPKWTS